MGHSRQKWGILVTIRHYIVLMKPKTLDAGHQYLSAALSLCISTASSQLLSGPF